MPSKRYIIKLTDAERQELQAMVKRGKHDARWVNRARILLEADSGQWNDEEIAERLSVSRTTVERVRKRAWEQGVKAAVEGKPLTWPRRERKMDGTLEAHVVALACSPPPEGRVRWTLQLLADRVVELGYVDSLSDESIRQVMKKKRAQTLAQRAVLHSA